MAARTETSSSSDSGRRRGSGRRRRIRKHGTKRDTSSSSSRSSSSSSRGKRKASSSSSPRRRRNKKDRSRSRDRSASNAKKGRKRRKRSSSPKKAPKQQGAGPRAQVMIPQLWPGAPQMWPISGAPGQTAQAQANGKEKKRTKKDKKEKKDAAGVAAAESRAEVAALRTQLKAMETKLQASDSRAESLSADLDAERGTKESLAKELAAARGELYELRQGGTLQAVDIQAELEAAWAPTIDALEARLRITSQELRVAARNIEERDSRIRKLGETLAARAVQIGSLSKARECLLTTITRMKQKHAVLRVKYLEEAQAAPGNAAPEGEESEGTLASSAVTASSSSTAKAAASTSAAPKPAARRAQAKVPAGPLPHRTMSSPSSVLRAPSTGKRRRVEDGAEVNGKGNGNITFTEGALEVFYEIASFKDCGKQLWVQKPGTKVYCDQCFRRVPQARGNLQQDPTRSQFSQERFLCEECNTAALALRGVGDGEQSTGSAADTQDAADGSKAAAPKLNKRHRVISKAMSASQSNIQNGVPVQGVNEAATAPGSVVAASAGAGAGTPASTTAAIPQTAGPASTTASATGGSAAAAAASATVAGTGKEVGAASAPSAPATDAKPNSVSNALKSTPSFAELLTETCRAAAQSQQ